MVADVKDKAENPLNLLACKAQITRMRFYDRIARAHTHTQAHFRNTMGEARMLRPSSPQSSNSR